MIAGLLWGKFANRRENTKSIAGQHDDIRRLTLHQTRNLGIRDVLNRIRAPCVLSNANVIIIRSAGDRVVHYVFEDTAKADGVIDIRFLLGGEVDAFSITTSFDVKDASIGPDMLVVSDEKTVRVSRQSGLASSRKTEEESDVAFVLSNIGGGMKGKLAELDGLEVMLETRVIRNRHYYLPYAAVAYHDGEDALLHLAGVFSTEDDHLHALEVDLNRCGRAHSLGETIGRELTSVVDDELGLAKVSELFFGRTDEHVMLPFFC